MSDTPKLPDKMTAENLRGQTLSDVCRQLLARIETLEAKVERLEAGQK